MTRILSASLCISVLAAAVALGFAGVGFNPYVTNTIRHGHPFHPAFGRDARPAVVTMHMPEDFQGRSRLTKLVRSIFSKSRNVRVSGERYRSELKVPLWIHNRHEVTTFASTSTRLGGWGPLFGGAVLIAGALAAAPFFKKLWND